MYSVVLFNEKKFTKKYITLFNGEKKTFNKNSKNFIVVYKTFLMMFMNFSK